MMFRIDRDEIEIIDLAYEDYHQEVVMSMIAGFRMKNPAHPGCFIKHEIIESLEPVGHRGGERAGRHARHAFYFAQ